MLVMQRMMTLLYEPQIENVFESKQTLKGVKYDSQDKIA
jgi:hypothetical protein